MMLNNFSHFLAFEEIPESERSQVCRLSSFGHTLLGKGQFAPALERFDSVIRAQPDCFAAWLGRAKALRGLCSYSLALNSLHRVEGLLPQPQTWLLLEKAELWMELRQFEPALEACESALRLSPRQIRLHFLRLELLWRLRARFQPVFGRGRWSVASVEDETMNLIPVVVPGD